MRSCQKFFKNRVDLLIDGGRSPLGTESTIIDMSNKPKILRLGAISIEDIEKSNWKDIGRNL